MAARLIWRGQTVSKKIADLCGEVTDAIEEDKLDPATTTALRLHSQCWR